ncbi:MAG: 4a-hydroxytetrahydrobiopterin dehydratase [Saprospiraceae bacterium]|nr:4a-hydroxytetrahydrobiopterin dehydratase [Saprospiraceae bacterium]
MWIEKDNRLCCKLKFIDFKEAMIFINCMAELADEMDHHPEFTSAYNRVFIVLTTHSAGDIITEKDRIMAQKIDEILEKLNSTR